MTEHRIEKQQTIPHRFNTLFIELTSQLERFQQNPKPSAHKKNIVFIRYVYKTHNVEEICDSYLFEMLCSNKRQLYIIEAIKMYATNHGIFATC